MMNLFKRRNATAVAPVTKPVRSGVFSTDALMELSSNGELELVDIEARAFQKKAPVLVNAKGVAMDSASSTAIKSAFSLQGGALNQLQLGWYALQSFIGYQACAILAQHWLIDKACTVPAQDAVRKGFTLTKNDGEELDSATMQTITDANKRLKLDANLIELVRMGRIFGVRIAMFVVETPDPIAYYQNPFNIDAVTPGSYRGISQIDPYWIMPELDEEATADPSSMNFYEPTWWRISTSRVGSLRVHRSHLVIMRHSEVADILKPSYYYGGVPLPQQIHERVYAAERTANEAPQLALSKRTTIIKTNIDQALAKQGNVEKRIGIWARFRDNWGVKLLGKGEEAQQFDTALADLDATIMTQYQLVAAIARVPVTKLLGTTPKGFNATGEFDEANYHEELESIQTTFLAPMVERHLQLLIRSEIAPSAPFSVDIRWEELDAMTSKEQAEVNKLNAEAGQLLIQSGAIDGADERGRIINDPGSGYNGLSDMDLVNEPVDAPIINE